MRRGAFHHLAGIHDRDPVGHARNDAEVVGDQQQRQAEFALQRLQQAEDLRLHGDIERGGGFVGDQQFRLAHQRHRDHHPLAQAAGKLVRILPEAHARRGDTHTAEQFGGAFERGGARTAAVAFQHLGHL